MWLIKAIERSDSVIDYASQISKCRSKFLLNYFGETETYRCGICDICLERNKIKLSDLEFDSILDIIKPTYVVPFAGDFGWFHKFQYDHNFYARATPLELNEHILNKGFDLIPLIIQYLLKNKIDNFHWVLIGGGCSKIDNLLDDNTREYITIHETIGSISDDSFPSKKLIEHYKTADIFCFPTYVESFGIQCPPAPALG